MKKAGNISEFLAKLKNNTISKDELKILFDTLKKSEADQELKLAFDEHWHLMEKRGMPGEADPLLQAGQFSTVLKRAREREERELQQLQRGRKKAYKWYGAAAVIASSFSYRHWPTHYFILVAIERSSTSRRLFNGLSGRPCEGRI